MQTFAFIVIVVLAVVVSQPLARLLKVVPLPILQIAIGAALVRPVTGGLHVEIEPDLFLLIFIPPLLFADAWRAPKREYRRLLRPILSLAVGLVFFTILGFGLALHWLVPEMPLAVAFALAAVLSPTDAVAVSSIIDKNSVPKSLLHILEGESLFNDASGLVMFRFATAAVLTGSFSLGQVSVSFALAVLGGIAAGLLTLLVVTGALKLLAKVDDIAPESQVLVMLLLPFTAYLTAESWQASGVLAAVVAGLAFGRVGAANHLSVSAHMLATAMWSMLSFVFNGAIFVLLGLQLPAIIEAVPQALTGWHWLWQPIATLLALTLCLIALRYVWISVAVFLGNIVNRMIRQPRIVVGARTRVAGSVAGVRGAVTLAGVLSLPTLMLDGTAFPARDLSIFIAAGVILCWLAIAGIGLPRIVRGLAAEHGGGHALAERQARIELVQAAIRQLEGAAYQDAGENRDQHGAPDQAVVEAVIASYRHRLALLNGGDAPDRNAEQTHKAEAALRRSAIGAERQAAKDLLRKGDIDEETFRTLIREVTLDEALETSRRKER